ncbi:MAG: hypothetical protein P8Y80_10290 [Acidobacteriota bacterium]|jgi:hypothetical protein
MNCRTFQKNLEDYLQNGLDFAGRFGMERHARQCIHCGKEMTDAQHLSRLVQGIERIKAPANFESSVLNEIGKRKLRRSFLPFGWFMVFGLNMLAWRKYALAASAIVAVGLGSFYWYSHQTSDAPQAPSWTSNIPDNLDLDALEYSNDNSVNSAITPEVSVPRVDPRFNPLREELSVNYQTNESDYGEYTIIGPDNLPMVIPLPNTIKVEIHPPSEEFFIRNVSH